MAKPAIKVIPATAKAAHSDRFIVRNNNSYKAINEVPSKNFIVLLLVSKNMSPARGFAGGVVVKLTLGAVNLTAVSNLLRRSFNCANRTRKSGGWFMYAMILSSL